MLAYSPHQIYQTAAERYAMMASRRFWVALLLLGLLGCSGKSSRVPVAGTVTLDGKPLADASVSFHPRDQTPGLGGQGRTGTDGKYAITPARHADGLDPGDYTVVISRPLRRDGSPPPPNVPPIESDARETLPPIYSSRSDSTLKATVSPDTNSYDFALQSAPKP
jgi:hypothetical protein